MALVIATISVTMAESICSNYGGERGLCEKQVGVCHWIRRQHTCFPVPTLGECMEKAKRLQCRKLGCVWNNDDETCLLGMDGISRPLFINKDRDQSGRFKDEDHQRPFLALDKDRQRSLNAEEEEDPSDLYKDVLPQTRPLIVDEDRRRPPNDDEDEDQVDQYKDVLPQTRPILIEEDQERPLNDDEEEDQADHYKDALPQTRPILIEEDQERSPNADEEKNQADHYKDEQPQTRPIIIDGDEDEDPSNLYKDEQPQTRPMIIDEERDRLPIVDEVEIPSDNYQDEDMTRPLFINIDEDLVARPLFVNKDVLEDVDEEVSEDSDLSRFDEDQDQVARPLIINEEVGEYIDEDEDAGDKSDLPRVAVSRDANGIPQSEREFWKHMRGMNIKLAKEEIKQEFGEDYNVYVCRKRRFSMECFARNIDYSRVRIWPRQQRKVKKVVIG